MRGRLAMTIALALTVLLVHELTMALSGHMQASAGNEITEGHHHHVEGASSNADESTMPGELPDPCDIVRELAPTLQVPPSATGQAAIFPGTEPYGAKQAGRAPRSALPPPLPAVVRRALLQVYRI